MTCRRLRSNIWQNFRSFRIVSNRFVSLNYVVLTCPACGYIHTLKGKSKHTYLLFLEHERELSSCQFPSFCDLSLKKLESYEVFLFVILVNSICERSWTTYTCFLVLLTFMIILPLDWVSRFFFLLTDVRIWCRCQINNCTTWDSRVSCK